MKATNKNISCISITFAFFMWGLLTSLNDILIPHLKKLFVLSYTEVMLVQFVFFMTYAVLSIPLSRVLAKIGYKWSIVLGFTIGGLGCLGFWPSAQYSIYLFFLLSLILLAAGIVMLQVAANPYISLLGEAKTASARLTFAQAMNSFGTTVGPLLGGVFILGAIAASGNNLEKIAWAVQLPYIVIAAIMFFMGLFFVIFPLKKLSFSTGDSSKHSFIEQLQLIFKEKHLVYGCIGIFMYVGAEVSIGSFLVNYLGQESVMSFSPDVAAKYIAFYWGGAMIGRFIGAYALDKVLPPKLLKLNSVIAICLIAISIFAGGKVSMWSILSVGLFNSILFPTIFSLGIRELKEKTELGSGLLCVSIAGGALVPLIQGEFADNISLSLSFLVPMLCYGYIFFYGLRGYNPKVPLT